MTIAERNNKLKHFITCLKCEVSGKCCDDNCSTQYDAGNMGEIIENLEAISKALEQEPYTNVGKYKDAISRQAVRDTIFAECSGTKLDIDFAKVLILQRAIKALPPVQPKSGWIPVSEKMPEKGGDYLVTIEWKGSYSGDVYTETNMAVYREKEKEWDCTGVVAWMPLPEPYKAELGGEE